MHAEHDSMRRFGELIDAEPSTILLNTVSWTAGYVAWLREKVARIDTDEELVWGQVEKTVTGSTVVVKHAVGENAWVALLGKWHDRLVRACEIALKAGVEERRVKLAEEQGEMVAAVFRSVLAELDLTPEQADRAATAVPKHLRLLAG